MNTEENYTTTNREGQSVAYAVPVIRHVWKRNKKDLVSEIRGKIRNARTIAEVNAFLEKSIAAAQSATPAVIAKWKRAAQIRVDELFEK